MDANFTGQLALVTNGAIHLQDGHGLEVTITLNTFTAFEYADTREVLEESRARINAHVSAWISMQPDCLNCIICELTID